MSSDLLDDIVIEVARISEEIPGNVIRVPQSFEDCVLEWELTSLSKLGLGILSSIV